MSDALDEAVERLHDGDAEGALADLRVLATREPLNADVHFQIGQCLAALGQFGPATVAYKMALRQAPTFLGAWVQLGLCERELGLLDDAIRSGEQALRLREDDCDALHLLGVALAERGHEGDVRAAEAHLRRALRAPGMSAEARADAELLHQALVLKLSRGAVAN
jgi:tetratricopeptide (TPR) repeat protein